jgi:hypothetical protein
MKKFIQNFCREASWKVNNWRWDDNIKMILVDGIGGIGFCLVVGFDNSSAEPLGSTARISSRKMCSSGYFVWDIWNLGLNARPHLEHI